MKTLYIASLFLLITSCRKEVTPYEENDVYAGGGETSFISGTGAYSQSFSHLSSLEASIHETGDGAFGAIFVTAPSPKNSGLGPIYNNVSCLSCHIGDGRGKAPEPGELFSSLLMRLSTDGENENGEPLEVPFFGGQLQNHATLNKAPEGNAAISYSFLVEQFNDGSSYELRVPSYTLSDLYKAFSVPVHISPRIAPPVFGLGFIEAIPTWSILANEDPTDANGDNISGKANYVWDVKKKQKVLGRFGWKANTPTLLQQVAAAYNEDMGITNFLYPIESSFNQPQYDFLNDELELSDSLLYATTFYLQTVAVPARRDATNPQVIQGKKLFTQLQCATCHHPSYRTAVNVSFKPLSNQLIFPYSDFLVHDMGEGLADHRADFLATGNEWRTPPLWGIGLSEVVNGHSNFLHDGRARTLEEAVLWHGGEAEKSKNSYKALPSTDRKALLKFLKSL